MNSLEPERLFELRNNLKDLFTDMISFKSSRNEIQVQDQDENLQINLIHAVSGGLIEQNFLFQNPSTNTGGPLTIDVIIEARCEDQMMAVDAFVDIVYEFCMKQA